MKIQLLRHATLVLSFNSTRIMVDPMLSPAGLMDPVTDTPNQQPNPLVELPIDSEELGNLIDNLDGVLVTHTHSDHWDLAAVEILPKELKVFCQPEDNEKISLVGFKDVQTIETELSWHGIHITRTSGKHGTGRIGELMGPVSGFVLEVEDEPSCYIAGDTIWGDEVKDVLEKFKPDVVVLNAGAAQFLSGDPITMTATDVLEVCKFSPDSRAIAVHMEAINHCLLTREQLRKAVYEAGFGRQAEIPLDGETLEL